MRFTSSLIILKNTLINKNKKGHTSTHDTRELKRNFIHISDEQGKCLENIDYLNILEIVGGCQSNKHSVSNNREKESNKE